MFAVVGYMFNRQGHQTKSTNTSALFECLLLFLYKKTAEVNILMTKYVF